MATKKTTTTKPPRKATKKTPNSKPKPKPAPPPSLSVKVRMYRQGLGDCFLITIPKADGSEFFFMIDCGVVLGTTDPSPKMQQVVQDIIKRTGGRVDVLAATHEHWDHLSAFVQVPELFAKASEPPSGNKLQVGQVWFAWTEDPSNVLAKALKKEKVDQIAALRAAANQLRGAAKSMGMQGSTVAEGIDNLLDFFGATGGTTFDALQALRTYINGDPAYCHPTDKPVELPGVEGMRVYVLGPPENEKFIKKTDSSTEVYKDTALAVSAAWNAAVGLAGSSAADDMQPFDRIYRYPLSGVKSAVALPAVSANSVTGFFDRYYFGKDTDSGLGDQSWRRIDADWLGASAELALALDNATNNTSLVLAFEFVQSGRVLLFAADAQVGNWLSWQDLKWKIGDTEVTGPDLLKRTVFYKVGHHGSHNATLKAKGLEMMTSRDLVAFIPVDHAMAVKKHWGRMPLPSLVDALKGQTQGRVVRIDEPFDPNAITDASVRAAFTQRLEETPLYFEITITEGVGQPSPRIATALA